MTSYPAVEWYIGTEGLYLQDESLLIAPDDWKRLSLFAGRVSALAKLQDKLLLACDDAIIYEADDPSALAVITARNQMTLLDQTLREQGLYLPVKA